MVLDTDGFIAAPSSHRHHPLLSTAISTSNLIFSQYDNIKIDRFTY
jgi:hypothetical protein